MEQTPDLAAPETEIGRTFSQADVDKIVSDRLAREKTQSASAMSALEQRLADHEATIEATRTAEMTAVEKITAERDKATKNLEDMQGRLKGMEVSQLRAAAISQSKTPNLPVAYQRLVEGETAEDIAASVDTVIVQFETDMKAIAPGTKVGIVTQAGDGGSDEPQEELSPLQKLLAAKAAQEGR